MRSVVRGCSGGCARAFAPLLLVLLLGPSPGHAAAPDIDVLETPDLKLLYIDPLQTYLTPHVARSFQNSLAFQRRIFDWKPWDPQMSVLLRDFSDAGNASASVSPTNLLLLDVAPPTHTFETLPGSERIYSAMNHELVHIAQGDAWNSRDAWWRGLFHGKVAATTEHPESILYQYLTTPRSVVPRWYAEGVAVFQETWMSGGIGRTQGAYDEMVFRAMVRDGARFYGNLGLVSTGTRVDFQTGANAYLYGTRFIGYLALQYSPEQVIEWIRRGEDSDRYYEKQFRRVFGLPLDKAWEDWIAWEKSFQEANLARVRTFPLTPARRIGRQALGSISRAFIDPADGAMIGGFRYPGVVAHVGSLSLGDGSMKRFADIKGPMLYSVTSAAFDPAARTFFYTADNSRYRDLMALDVASGKTRMLLEDARIGDLAFDASDRSLWGLRHLDGYVTLVRIPYPYERWNQVHTWPYGEVPFEMDVSPDGKRISVSMEKLDGSQNLHVYDTADLLAERVEPIAQFNFGSAIPEGFVFSPDGRYLFGSSYYTGISNIFRYEIATGDMEAVSNAETGFFRPIPRADGTLLVYEFTGDGFLPAIIDPVPLQDLGAVSFLGNEIVRRHPVVKDWAVGSPAKVPLDDMITKRGKYQPVREMAQTAGYPILEGYRDTVALGWNWEVQDPIMLSTLKFNVSGSIDGSLDQAERLHADVEYRWMDWRFRYWHNDADFYDLFGPTERSRKGDAFIVAYERPLIYDEPRRLDLETKLAWYTGLETLPGNQNVESGFSDLLSADFDLKYRNTRKSVGAVDDEKGIRWALGANLDRVHSELVSRFSAGVDLGFALPLRHSSIWLYNAAGFARGERSISLANWYFGAYGNNYVDDGEIKRYRELESFPGFEIDEIAGRDFCKSLLEWNLPPLIFEEVGTPSFYLSWMRPALFAGAMVTDVGDGRREETYGTLGMQLDFEFTLAHRLPLTLSLGYAQGFVGNERKDNEWLLSIKIL